MKTRFTASSDRTARLTRRLTGFAFVLMFSAGVHSSRAAEQVPEFTFGIVPQQSATMLARLWGPILLYLGEKSATSLRFHTAPDIPTFEKRVRAGDYAFAYMNPYHFTEFNKAPGYQAIAKAKGRLIHGIIVVRADSPVMKLEDLDGMTLAFPAPAAFAATVLPQSWLRKEGIRFTPAYVSSHDSVYLGVAKGIFPAGGGIVRTLKNVALDVASQLRVLWTTPGYTPHAFAVHPAIDATTRERVAQAMYEMADDPQGRKLLATIKLNGLERARNEDWDDVRALNILLLN